MESVTFLMAACETTRGPGDSEEWTLDFRAACPLARTRRVCSIRIGGLRPSALLAVRVLTETLDAFVLEAACDRIGRIVAAGDMLAALYGLGPGRCIQVAASDFHRPVAESGAAVQLRLQGILRVALTAVTVEGDCC